MAAGGRFVVDSPKTAHDLAYAAAWDAVSRAQRARIGAGSRAKQLPVGVSITPLRMTPSDRVLFVEIVQQWYRNFNILSAFQWMPAGYAWKRIRGEWRPMPTGSAS